MFKKRKINLVVLAFCCLGLGSCDKETVIPETDLPSEITTYINTHFPNIGILQVIKDRDGLTKTYDIILNDNVGLEFNRKKEVINIDGLYRLPDSVVPEKIRAYVASKFPNNVIIGWEIDGRNQQIELDNGLDLEFSMAGNFLRIDG